MIRENKGYLCKCVSKDKSEEKLKSGIKCAEDLAAVISLPDQWLPQQSGAILTNYLKERVDSFKATLCSMTKEETVVNKVIGEKIRDLAEKLYANIRESHITMEDIINNVSIAKDNFTKSRHVALEEVEKIYDKSIQDIEQFKINILNLEHLRCDELKFIFHGKFQDLVSIKHYTPENILQDFDEHVCGLNDELLTNLKAYFELVCQLRTHLDVIVTHARSILNKLGFSLTIPVDSNVVNNSGEVVESKKGKELDFKKNIVCLVDSCQGTLSKVCTKFFNHLDELQNNINNTNLGVKNQAISDLEDNINDGLTYITNRCIQYETLKHDDQIRKSIDYAKGSLSSFGDTLLSTYRVLYDICHILNAPSDRLALAQKLILAQIEDLQVNNVSKELSNEIGINVALEEMKGASEVDKVHHQYDILKTLLQKQDSFYIQYSESEANKIKGYLNLVSQVTDLFYLECSCYLKDQSNNLHLTHENTSIPDLDSNLLSFSRTLGYLPRTILQDQNKYTSLSNQISKFMASFEEKTSSLRDILNRQGQKWVDEKCLVINMRYSLKCMSHTVRNERVIAARNSRITELRIHESRLKSHLDTIYHLTRTLPTEATKFIDFDAKELYPFKYWVTQIQNNINLLTGQSDNNIDEFQVDPEMRKLKFRSYRLRLQKYRQLFEKSLESAVNFYKRTVEIRIQSGRIANLKFMEEIKLFNEGGSYAVAEAIKTSAVLVKAADALESCLNVSMDAVNHCQTHLLSVADELLLPLMQIVNEGTGRAGLLEKKKKSASKK